MKALVSGAGAKGGDARSFIEAHSHAKSVSTFAEGTSHSRFIPMIRGMTAPSFMDLALKTAENAGKAGEVPIGCVVVRDYEVIATASNRTLTDRDPTAHAEILAIRQAAETIGTERLIDCARIRRLYYGAADPKGGAVESGVRFFASPTCHHVPEIYSAVGEREAATLLRDFFKARR
jgi:tRNA(adenine34) deaminase